MVVNTKDIGTKVTFCSACYATSYDGSWGSNGWSVEDVENGYGNDYCLNCGGYGELLIMSKFSAERIREGASWIGKRYYPHEEDYWNEFEVRIGRNKSLTIQFKTWNGHTIGGNSKLFGLIHWRKKNNEGE